VARSLAVISVAVVVVGLCAARKTSVGSAATISGGCPATVAKRVANGSAVAPSSFNYGTGSLRAAIYWPHGTLTAGTLPQGGSMATINGDGSVSVKLGWWRGVPGSLIVIGWRLDGSAPPLGAEIPNGSYGSAGFIPSALTFPTPGCWRVIGQEGGVVGRRAHATLSLVVKVVKVKVSG